jgi:hypothetical protein
MVLSALLLRGLLLHWSCLGRYFFSFTKIRTKNYLLENDAIVNQRLLQLQSKNALLSTFLFLDQFVWLGRTGIYKNKERTDRIVRISLYCWMASSVCAGLVELGELKRLSKSMRKLARELRDTDKYENDQYKSKMKQSDERLLALVKAAMDVVVAVGLLQLSPKKITPRVTGAFGFVTSLISCYQQLPSRAPAIKVKA